MQKRDRTHWLQKSCWCIWIWSELKRELQINKVDVTKTVSENDHQRKLKTPKKIKFRILFHQEAGFNKEEDGVPEFGVEIKI